MPRLKTPEPESMIFTFGSNEAGIHGAGAAKYARQNHGAVLGIGNGLTGSSYAIPTKDKHIRTLPLTSIREYVDEFIQFAKDSPHLRFQVTQIGCGLAGYLSWQIAPMFEMAPDNCLFDRAWNQYLYGKNYWN